MDNQFQDLEWARPRIQARIKNNKKQGDGTSVSGLFTMLRKQPHFTLLGDYPIMWIIIDETKENAPNKIKNMLKKSKEYKDLSKKEKMQWYRSLSDFNSK